MAERVPSRQEAVAYLRLVMLGALIGIPAACVAAVFLALVHQIEHWLWDDLPSALGESSPPWYLVIGLPVAGAAVVFVARRFLPGDGGHPPLDGLGGAQMPLAYAPSIVVAAIGTLGFGAVLGPEAPLIALGSMVGLALTFLVRLDQRERTVVATAGSFAAISALFGGPVVGGTMMVEGGLGLGGALMPVLLPGFVAAACGYVIFVGLGSWGGLDSQSIEVPGLPQYDATHIYDLLLAIAVGVLASFAIEAVRRIGARVSRGERRMGMGVLLLGGGLAVGVLAQLADVLGADSQDVLFSGQASIPALLHEPSAKVVLVLFAAKALAYAVSLGSGFRGGPVFPAIFLGVGLATFVVVWFDVSPTVAVAIGSAAGMAAMTRLLLTSSLFATLLVGSAGPAAVPAAVLAAASAWLTTAAIDRHKAPTPVAAPRAAAPGAIHGPAADPDGVMVGERSLEDPAPVVDVGAGEAVLGRRVMVDDLTLIEGIDSDVAGTLRAAGIASWAALAASDAERLRSVVTTDDASSTGPDPTSWPEQPALALASRWADLKALQARLRVVP
jgi:H+/Cl- antiporter ClcA